MTAKVAPALLNITKSVDELKHPRELYSIFLNQSFVNLINRISGSCQEALHSVTSITYEYDTLTDDSSHSVDNSDHGSVNTLQNSLHNNDQFDIFNIALNNSNESECDEICYSELNL